MKKKLQQFCKAQSYQGPNFHIYIFFFIYKNKKNLNNKGPTSKQEETENSRKKLEEKGRNREKMGGKQKETERNMKKREETKSNGNEQEETG